MPDRRLSLQSARQTSRTINPPSRVPDRPPGHSTLPPECQTDLQDIRPSLQSARQISRTLDPPLPSRVGRRLERASALTTGQLGRGVGHLASIWSGWQAGGGGGSADRHRANSRPGVAEVAPSSKAADGRTGALTAPPTARTRRTAASLGRRAGLPAVHTSRTQQTAGLHRVFCMVKDQGLTCSSHWEDEGNGTVASGWHDMEQAERSTQVGQGRLRAVTSV